MTETAHPIMIDRLHLKLPVSHRRLDDGSLVKYGHRGHIDWQVRCSKIKLQGERSTTVMIRSLDTKGEIAQAIEIEGNPATWFQNHNAFGDGRVHLIAPAFARSVLELASVPISEEVWASILEGDFEIREIHLACAFRLENNEQAEHFLRQAVSTLSSRDGRKVEPYSDTIYIGRNSRSKKTTILYNKGVEMAPRLRSRSKYLTIHQRSALKDFCRGLVRLEIRLKSTWLKEHGLHQAHAWRPDVPEQLMRSEFELINIPPNVAIPQGLKLELNAAELYQVFQWESGSASATGSPRQKRRIAKSLKEKYGIDISKPFRHDAMRDQLAIGTRLIELQLVNMNPPWAREAGLYFDPEDAIGPKPASLG